MAMNKHLKKFLEMHPDIDPNGMEIFYVLLEEIGEMQDEREQKLKQTLK